MPALPAVVTWLVTVVAPAVARAALTAVALMTAVVGASRMMTAVALAPPAPPPRPAEGTAPAGTPTLRRGCALRCRTGGEL